MSNLLKCLTCGKTVTSEESDTHSCKPLIKRHRVIQAASYFTTKDDNGITNLVIDGFDNIGYVFEIKEPRLVPLELSCDSITRRNLTGGRSDDNLPEPN